MSNINMLAALGGGTQYKSTQRGTMTFAGASLTADITVSAVDLSKANLVYLGCAPSVDSVVGMAYIYFLNSTTVRAARVSGSIATVVSFEIVERI